MRLLRGEKSVICLSRSIEPISNFASWCSCCGLISLDPSLFKNMPFLALFTLCLLRSAGLIFGLSFNSYFIHYRISPIPAFMSGLEPTLRGLFGLLDPVSEYALLLSLASLIYLNFFSSSGPYCYINYSAFMNPPPTRTKRLPLTSFTIIYFVPNWYLSCCNLLTFKSKAAELMNCAKHSSVKSPF